MVCSLQICFPSSVLESYHSVNCWQRTMTYNWCAGRDPQALIPCKNPAVCYNAPIIPWRRRRRGEERWWLPKPVRLKTSGPCHLHSDLAPPSQLKTFQFVLKIDNYRIRMCFWKAQFDFLPKISIFCKLQWFILKESTKHSKNIQIKLLFR